MYFGTRCASFAGSFEQPTTAIVWMSPRIVRICVSSTIGPRFRKRAFRLRFLREDASNRVLQTRRETQMLRFVWGEPPDLRVLVVRDPRLAVPSGDEEQVVAEELLRRGIDVFVDAEEPGLQRRDAQLFLELADQGNRWFLARDQMASEGVPHAREPNRAGSSPQEHATVAGNQTRCGDVNHAATKDIRGYSFFSKFGRYLSTVPSQRFMGWTPA